MSANTTDRKQASTTTGNAAAPAPAPMRRASINSFPAAGTDLSQSQLASVYEAQGANKHRLEALENKVAIISDNLNNMDADIINQFGSHTSRFDALESNAAAMKRNVQDLNTDILEIRRVLGVKDMNIDRNIELVVDDIKKFYNDHIEAVAKSNAADNDTDRAANTQTAADAKTSYQKLVRQYLELIVDRDMGMTDDSNLRTEIRTLRTRLADQLEKPLANPVSRWSALVSTNVKAKAVAAVTRLSTNPAFETKGRDDVQLKVNIDVLTLMTHAVFVLEQDSKKSSNAPTQPVGGVGSPEKQPHSLDESKSPTPAVVGQIAESAQILNTAVLTTLHDDLAAIKTRADGLIGSQNKDWQFWGNVLKAIAVIILATLATAAIMSFVGFTAPAFMLNVAATIKANAMISTVLNVVAAKLGVDLNVAAGATLLGAATTFGVFGKLTHMVGAPSRYKQELDRAVNAVDAALPTALPMTPRGM